MGLFKSAVLSTFPIPKLVRAAAAVVAPVPPLAIATTPVTFPAVIAALAKGTDSSLSTDNSSNWLHNPVASRATFMDLSAVALQTTAAKEPA